MSKSLLIAAVVVLPAVWGCLSEVLLRLIWPRTHTPMASVPHSVSDVGSASVDFQI